MIIMENVYNDVMEKCAISHIETGGILGGKNDIIFKFEFDKGTNLSSVQHYYPNIEGLNACLENWLIENIDFYGIVHSHIHKLRDLSSNDIQYIQTIMNAMPEKIQLLFFPIVLPGKEMLSFKAIRQNNKINIVTDDIKIYKREW